MLVSQDHAGPNDSRNLTHSKHTTACYISLGHSASYQASNLYLQVWLTRMHVPGELLLTLLVVMFADTNSFSKTADQSWTVT